MKRAILVLILSITSVLMATESYPHSILEWQRSVIAQPSAMYTSEDFSPPGFYDSIEKASVSKMGCLVLAGGQGTRLGIAGPKGKVAVSPLLGKSFFQLIAEKMAAASRLANECLPLAIMTCPLNHDETVSFFEENGYFGLDANQVDFFMQRTLPLVDDMGNWMYDESGNIVCGSDGNGSALRLLYESGIYEKWRKQGIAHVSVIPIENPLADPVDVDLYSLLKKEGVDLAIKCLARSDPFEKVGIMVEDKGRLYVREYSEVSDSLRLAKDSDGNLCYHLAYIGLFACSLDFIGKIGREEKELPWHLAKKQGIKFETFIFDNFVFADSYAIVLGKREDCFSPVKTNVGFSSLETARADMLSRDRRMLSQLIGTPIVSGDYELDPHFYYASETLVKQWSGASVPKEGYIE